MKRILTLLACAAPLTTACQKNELLNPVETQEQNDSAKDILLAVQNIYTLDNFYETETDYVFVFLNPSPLKLKNSYPDGIRSVSLNKDIVMLYKRDESAVSITFYDGQKAVFAYTDSIAVTFDKNYVLFDETGGTQEITYKAVCRNPEQLDVKVERLKDCFAAEIKPDSTDRCKGTIIFTKLTDEIMTIEALVVFTCGKQYGKATVNVKYDKFTFDDGTHEKTFSFPDYERIFGFQVDKTNVTASVNDNADWLKVNVEHASEESRIWIYVAENMGNSERHGTVTIRCEALDREVYLHVNQIGGQMDGSVRKALTSLYKATKGEGWKRNKNWCTDARLMDWEGVGPTVATGRDGFGLDGITTYGTEPNWKIVTTGLYQTTQNGLFGTIPDEFWKVCGEYFTQIIMPGEYLIGQTVPDYIWNEKLEVLDLHDTGLNISLKNVSKAVNLQKLNLRCTIIDEPFTSDILKCKKLWYLNLHNTQLSGQLPDIGMLKDLQSLTLSNNPYLTGTLSDNFYSLYNLKVVELSFTPIGGIIKPEIRNLTNLQTFNAECCEFEGALPEEFGTLPTLWYYDFNGNYINVLPQFPRYIGTRQNHSSRSWNNDQMFFEYVPYYQRKKEEGRTIMVYENCDDETCRKIIIEGKSFISLFKNSGGTSLVKDENGNELNAGYIMSASRKFYYMLPFPMWARVKYGLLCWNVCDDKEWTHSEYPQCNDLQYPADEYYWDGQNWRHPKLEYPAKEYWFNGTEWIHDASCPWEQLYLYDDWKDEVWNIRWYYPPQE